MDAARHTRPGLLPRSVPHRSGVYILSFMVLQDWLVRLEREDGLPRIVVQRLASGEEHVISFAEEAYSLGIDDGYEFATDVLRFTYSSMTTPEEVWDYDLASRQRTLRKRQQIPTGHSSADYITRRLFAPPPTAKRFRFHCFTARMSPSTGPTPCLLYGYGAYGISMPAAFSSYRLSGRSRFVYAIAHVRGGSEKGWRCYAKASLKKDATPLLISSARASISAKTALRAGDDRGRRPSVGGTLIGAVGNMRPDLYAGLIAGVPFVDVLNTMLDETLPLMLPEWPEWGDPNRDAAAFRTILAYCLMRMCARSVSVDPRTGGPDRSACAVLGTGEVDRATAALAHGPERDCLSHRPRRRSRRRRGVRPPQGSGARLCLRDQGRRRSTVISATKIAQRGDRTGICRTPRQPHLALALAMS